MKSITSMYKGIDSKGYLSSERYEHSLHVAALAERLCVQYNIESYKGYIAGLMHDIAREMPDKVLLELALSDGKSIASWEKAKPVLLHGRAGAVVLKKDFGITDSSILEAVRVHVTGKPGMSVLSKIIFISDFLEPTREFIDAKVRQKIIMLPIDSAVVKVLEMIFSYLKCEGKSIAPPAKALYEELLSVKFS